MRKAIVLIAVYFFINSVYAQEEPIENEEEAKHLVAVSFGYSYIQKGASEHAHEADGIFISSVGLDYLYSISPRWSVGTMIDFELVEYLILHKDLNREYALVVTAIANFAVTDNIDLFAGPGIELEKNYNLFVFRFGGAYIFNLKNQFNLSPGLIYDIKEGYNTFSVSLALTKEF